MVYFKWTSMKPKKPCLLRGLFKQSTGHRSSMELIKNEINSFKNKVFEEPLIIKDQSYKGLVFNNCQFKDGVIFDNLDLGHGAYFEECIFDKRILIKDCRTNNESNAIVQDEGGFSLTFKGCKVYHQLLILGHHDTQIVHPTILKRGILIDNTEIEDIYFEMIYILHNGLSIKESTIKKNIHLVNSKIKEIVLHFTKSKIEGHVRIETVDAASYSFIDTIFEKNVYLWNAELTDSITFNYGSYLDDFEIIAIKCRGLYIHDVNFKKHLRVRYFDNNIVEGRMGADEIYVKNSKFAESLTVLGSEDETKTLIKKITVASTKEQEGDIFFNKFMVEDEVLLEGTNYSNSIQFQNIETKKINIVNFTNFATVTFQNFKSTNVTDSIFNIQNSNLGNSFFLNCNLNSFSIVNIIDSILNKMSISNVEWFDPTKVNEYNEPKDKIYWSRKREVFKQLKYCLEENKDRINALDFKLYETKAYQKELKKSRGRYADKFLLNLNLLSNKHGLSWTRGLIFTFTCWITLYSSFVMVRDGIAFPWNRDCIFLLFDSSFWEEAINFLWLPEGLDSLTNTENGLFSTNQWYKLLLGTFFFLLGKVAIAYGIFQTISAFRKYGKS